MSIHELKCQYFAAILCEDYLVLVEIQNKLFLTFGKIPTLFGLVLHTFSFKKILKAD